MIAYATYLGGSDDDADVQENAFVDVALCERLLNVPAMIRALCPDCAHADPTPSHLIPTIVLGAPRPDGAAMV